MSLVLDTGVVVAAADANDPDHTLCAALLATTTERRIVPAPVLVEVDHLLRDDRAMPLILRDITAGGLTVEDLTIDDYTRVASLQERYADLRVGFVDCAVLAIVERLGEEKLATLDHQHFSVLRPQHVGALTLLP